MARAYEINKAEFLANERTRLKNLAKVKKEQQEEELKRNQHKKSLIADIEKREARRKEVCLRSCRFWVRLLIDADVTTQMSRTWF